MVIIGVNFEVVDVKECLLVCVLCGLGLNVWMYLFVIEIKSLWECYKYF